MGRGSPAAFFCCHDSPSFDATPFRSTTYSYADQIVYHDPLAETFTPPQGSLITDVNVWINRDASRSSTAN